MSFLGRSSLNERKPIWFPKILLDEVQYFHIILPLFLYIDFILPTSQMSGITPELNITLHIFS
jgi:hypothetical protein